MKKYFSLFLMLFSVSLFAANIFASEIESADLICEQPGMMVAFDSDNERVWLGEYGEETGYELEVEEFTIYRNLPYEFQVVAVMSFDGYGEAKMKYKTVNRGEKGIFLNSFGYDEEADEFIPILKKVPCRVVEDKEEGK